jgi:thiol-disulfide isomerase/thioredoxin
MNKHIVLSLGMSILLIASVSAISTDFFYSESCPHCKQVVPIVVELSQYFPINFLDVSKGSYDVQGVPLVRILTSDCRNINLVGSQEISEYLECELNEMSTKNCPTYSGDYNKDTQSWFIR